MQLWELQKKGKKNFITTIESAKINPKEFNNVFSKLCLNIIDQSEKIFLEIDNFDEIRLNERLINQTADFCIRILFSYGIEKQDKTISYYDFITKLESLGDRFFQIALHYHNKEKFNSFDKDCLEKISNFVREIVRLQKKFDFGKTVCLNKEICRILREYEYKTKRLKTNLISHNVYAILLELSEIMEGLYFLNNEFFEDR